MAPGRDAQQSAEVDPAIERRSLLPACSAGTARPAGTRTSPGSRCLATRSSFSRSVTLAGSKRSESGSSRGLSRVGDFPSSVSDVRHHFAATSPLRAGKPVRSRSDKPRRWIRRFCPNGCWSPMSGPCPCPIRRPPRRRCAPGRRGARGDGPMGAGSHSCSPAAPGAGKTRPALKLARRHSGLPGRRAPWVVAYPTGPLTSTVGAGPRAGWALSSRWSAASPRPPRGFRWRGR